MRHGSSEKIEPALHAITTFLVANNLLSWDAANLTACVKNFFMNLQPSQTSFLSLRNLKSSSSCRSWYSDDTNILDVKAFLLSQLCHQPVLTVPVLPCKLLLFERCLRSIAVLLRHVTGGRIRGSLLCVCNDADLLFMYLAILLGKTTVATFYLAILPP